MPVTQREKFEWSHPAALEKEALLAECEFGKGRTSGPGGQHRNKVETEVTLTHKASGVSAKAGERRSVRENMPVAIKRLRLKLAMDVRRPVPLGEIGSECWRSRVRPPGKGPGVDAKALGRLEINAKHWDYPSLLAEAIDVIADANWDVKRAGIRLDVSASQLVKLLKEHPPALGMLNAERKKRGEREFK